MFPLSRSSVQSALEPNNPAFGDNVHENIGDQFPLELASPPLELAPEIVMQYISQNVPNIVSTNYFSQAVNIPIPCGPRTGAIMGGTLHVDLEVRFEISPDDAFFPADLVVNRSPVTDALIPYTSGKDQTGKDIVTSICPVEGTSTIVIPPSIKRNLPRFMCGTSESLKASETTRINDGAIPIGTHNH